MLGWVGGSSHRVTSGGLLRRTTAGGIDRSARCALWRGPRLDRQLVTRKAVVFHAVGVAEPPIWPSAEDDGGWSHRFVDAVYGIPRARVRIDDVIAKQRELWVRSGVLVGGERSGDRPVAVKALQPDVGRGSPAAELLSREAAMLATLQHPHILRVLAVARGEGEGERRGKGEWLPDDLLVTELAAEGSAVRTPLAGWVRTDGPVGAGAEADGRLLLLKQVADALTYLHGLDHPVVHRDVKAANVFVRSLGADSAAPDIALGDFGLAWRLAGDGSAEDVAPGVCGSILHMAPEAHRGEGAGTASDVFAFGCLIVEVMQRQSPHLGLLAPGSPGSITREEFTQRVGNGDLVPSFKGEAADQLERVLRSVAEMCWSCDASKRPTMAEITEMLDAPVPGLALRDYGASVCLSAGAAARKGMRRRMEDTATLRRMFPKPALIGTVLDGHGGPAVAAALAQRLPAITEWELVASGNLSPEVVEDALRETFAVADDVIGEMAEEVRKQGSTATVAVVTPDHVTVATAGDSSGVLLVRPREKQPAGSGGAGAVDGEGNEARPFTALPLQNGADEAQRHSPSDALEAARIEAAGGVVRRAVAMRDDGVEMPVGPPRVYTAEGRGGLAVSRALGNHHMKHLIVSEPRVVQFARASGDHELEKRPTALEGFDPAMSDWENVLVIATDGVWDVLSPDDVGRLLSRALDDARDDAADAWCSVGSRADTQLARSVVSEAVKRGSADNCCAIVVHLN